MSAWSTVTDSLVRVLDLTATHGPNGIPSPHDIRSAPLVTALNRSSESETARIAWLILACLLNLVAYPLGISPVAALAMAILETGWNDSARVLFGTRNFWNVKGGYGPTAYAGAVALVPQLSRLGPPARELRSPSGEFRAYRDPIEAMADLARLARVERYANTGVARLDQTPDAQVRAWQRGGYNPEPEWASDVISIMRRLQGILPTGTTAPN